jgi:hypothetical protein
VTVRRRPFPIRMPVLMSRIGTGYDGAIRQYPIIFPALKWLAKPYTFHHYRYRTPYFVAEFKLTHKIIFHMLSYEK